MKALFCSLALGASLFAGQAGAVVIGFDDLSGNASRVPDGYRGFDWNLFSALNGPRLLPDGSGYENGTVSPRNVGYNSFAALATISVRSGTFTFYGGQFTAAWNNGLNLEIKGYNDATQLFSLDQLLNADGPTAINVIWAGLDRITFASSGGVNAGFGDHSGEHFAVDDLSLAAVPEPTTWVLMIGGLGLIGGAFRHRSAHGAAR